MKYLQRLGKSLMLPVACLPVAGILMGLGYAISPATMQGGDITGVLPIIGFFLIKAGGALIDNIPILFVIGVSLGMADEKDGTSALGGIASWLMITTLLNPGTVSVITGTAADPAFGKIGNAFVGILAGLIGALCYNRFKNTKLPDALAFFGGKRSVTIVSAMVSIVVSVALFFAWPILYNALVALGMAMTNLGPVGAGLYAFFNRLLIPTGLHHALNAVFWFDIANINDLGNFWAGTGTYGVTGQYMTGFFPFMMFGLPAACLAMYHTAKSHKKKMVYGLLTAAAVCSIISGVTEPIEFAFMFLAPGLYLVHAGLAGITAAITVALPVRAGFSFSGGAIDLFFSSLTPMAQNPWLIIPIGLGVAVIYYFLFRFIITKFNLKTPGREDDESDDVNAVLANDDFTAIARQVLEGLGGAANIASLDNCVTRLRIEVKDYTQVNERKIKAAGVAGVMRPSKTAVQVIIGTKVQFVADEMSKLL